VSGPAATTAVPNLDLLSVLNLTVPDLPIPCGDSLPGLLICSIPFE
jgi:hypothetical protein